MITFSSLIILLFNFCQCKLTVQQCCYHLIAIIWTDLTTFFICHGNSLFKKIIKNENTQFWTKSSFTYYSASIERISVFCEFL
jgi:hypothetical protein